MADTTLADAPITEVRVFAAGEPGGRGWALTTRLADHEICHIVTAFHVVGDRATRLQKPDIRVAGAGVDTPLPAELLESERDLALLRLRDRGPCPFRPGKSARRHLQGLWLVRLSDGHVIEELRADRAAPIQPLGSDGDIARLRLTRESRQTVAEGWSGASVFQDGQRIGLVSSVSDDGAAVRFYTTGAIAKAFGQRLRRGCDRSDEPCLSTTDTAPPVCPPLFGVRVRLVHARDNASEAAAFAAALQKAGAFVMEDPRLRAQLPPETTAGLTDDLSDITGDIRFCVGGWVTILPQDVIVQPISDPMPTSDNFRSLVISVGADASIRGDQQ
ncbi:hypothetical protein [Rhodovulum sp. P5]|uniref:hypothetical protein n=1 Tax=Rhodovulum sp. P5 TaxID=1564506 RepID=UPI0012EB79A9|nr:hypothetical protein [Rhodovulum sp. P5]